MAAVDDRPRVGKFVRLRSRADGAALADPRLRPMLDEEARRRETNVSEVVNLIVARRLRMPYEITGRASPDRDGGDDALHVYLDAGILDALERLFPTKWQDGFRRILHDHFALPMPPKVKRTRQRRKRADA